MFHGCWSPKFQSVWLSANRDLTRLESTPVKDMGSALPGLKKRVSLTYLVTRLHILS